MENNARKAMFNASYIQVKRLVNSRVSFHTSDLIFRLAQPCCFLPFWGQETAVANTTVTPESQVASTVEIRAVLGSQHTTSKTHQEKPCMCWFDSK